MPIVFLNPVPASASAVDGLESRLGISLPPAFRALLETVSNGGEVEPAVVRSSDEVGVVAVLGVGRRDHLDLERRFAQYSNGRLPVGLIPVADAEGGNLVCISVRPLDAGSVWFWDHERELIEDPASKLADDFDEWLADLGPLDESGLPAAVTEAWIDPSLLSELSDD